MSRPPIVTYVSTAVLCGTLGMALASPFTATANEGGIFTQLKIGQRLLGRKTTSPDPNYIENTAQAITDIALSLKTETRTQALTVEAHAGYRFVDSDDGAGFVGGASDPSLRITYSEVAANASLNVTSETRQTNLAHTNPLDAARTADGVLASDVADLTGTGLRTSGSVAAELALRNDAPWGVTLQAGVDKVSYEDTTNPALRNSTRIRLGVENRFDISDVMRATLGLHYTQTDIDGLATRDRYGIDAGVMITRPNGTIGLTLAAAEGTDGTQTSAQVTRNYNLERTQVQLGLGVTQATTGATYTTALAGLSHSFGEDSAFGPVKARAERRMGLGSADQEQIVTSLAVNTSYAVSPAVTLSGRAGYAQTEDVASGQTTELANAGLSVAYAISPDWDLTGSVTGQLREATGEARATSTTVAVGVTRSFDARR